MGIDKAMKRVNEMSESELVQMVAEDYKENRMYTVAYSLAIIALREYFDFPEDSDNEEAVKIISEKYPEYFL